jgi:hypothetical protein
MVLGWILCRDLLHSMLAPSVELKEGYALAVWKEGAGSSNFLFFSFLFFSFHHSVCSARAHFV